MSADTGLRMRPVRAGVIDVGSNTVRLLVAGPGRRGLDTILSERTHVGLAADVERDGRISPARLERVRNLAAAYAALAKAYGVDRLEVVVTAPGRQSGNPAELHAALAESTGTRVRQLSAEEEGRLAYAGAVCACRTVPDTVAVVDVGGGSSQVMVGTAEGPAWLRTLELGSLRLTERFVRWDPPLPHELRAVSEAVEREFEGLTPPLPLSALATGGTARALRRIVGRRLGEKGLTGVLELLAATPAAEFAAEHEVPPERARVLPAGTILLRGAQRRLGVKLEVAKGGVREGAVRGLLAELAAEAAA
jgi:exopolyphosphatase / guanosine-5'-triphosphate,3'-diphosphate pyrophosphatase